MYLYIGLLFVLSGCGGDSGKENGGSGGFRGNVEENYGGTPAHLVPQDEKIMISFAHNLPEYYKAIGATMPPDTLESYKTVTSSRAVENHYSVLFNVIRQLLPLINKAIHLSDSRSGKVAPIPTVHYLVTAIREFNNFVRTNKELYSWRGASALRVCMNILHTRSQKRTAFMDSFHFDSLYKNLSRYFRTRKQNSGDPNTLAISFLEKYPFEVFLETILLEKGDMIVKVGTLRKLRDALASIKEDSPQNGKMFSLLDEYVDLVEKRNHAHSLEDDAKFTKAMILKVSENMKLIDSIPVS